MNGKEKVWLTKSEGEALDWKELIVHHVPQRAAGLILMYHISMIGQESLNGANIGKLLLMINLRNWDWI